MKDLFKDPLVLLFSIVFFVVSFITLIILISAVYHYAQIVEINVGQTVNSVCGY